jgi:hypothetical protein
MPSVSAPESTPPEMDRGSVLMIAATNVLALAVAWWQQWSLLLLLWPYWVQNLVIGWYSGRRILALQRFSLEGTQGFHGGSDEQIKRNTVRFFAMHYGLFHFVYFVFLMMFTAKGLPHQAPDLVSWHDVVWIAFLGLSFVFTHRSSFRRNIESDRRGCPNIGTLMFLPYARVVPMHLMILLGLQLGFTGAVLLFGVLKTAADVLMHWVEHRVLASARGTAPKLEL